jgi:hypothetical protein
MAGGFEGAPQEDSIKNPVTVKPFPFYVRIKQAMLPDPSHLHFIAANLDVEKMKHNCVLDENTRGTCSKCMRNIYHKFENNLITDFISQPCELSCNLFS